jgi:hypothetical protein
MPDLGDARGGAAGEAARWADLCERFHDIRQRAYAHGLEERWRSLAGAPPQSPGLLAGWRELAQEVERLDEGQDDWAVRHGEDDTTQNAEDDDWWDGWGGPADRFECPAVRCGRTASYGLLPPRCWLFDRKMTRVGDGGTGDESAN